ncbi:MAG TPA: ABC transporter permease [Candidatus Acidoferrales bacterium]|nr:ABC transporter permease [Candidatus Acidoferrales bacterium]
MSTLFQDLRYAARMLAKAPGFTAIAIITLALGIGANAAIFSVADALLLRPEPFPNLGRLVLMFNRVAPLTNENEMYPADYEAIRAQSRSFEQLGAYFNRNVSLTGQGNPEREQAAKVTTNFFDMLGVKPLLGRGFTADEGAPGRDDETVLGYGLWQSKFGGDPNIIGKEIHINGQSFTIIGVMGTDFNYPPATNLWTPIAFVDADKSDRSNNYILPIGLLKPGVSVSQAVVELTGIGQRLAKEFPRTDGKMEIRTVAFRTYATDEQTHNFMLLLLAAVGFVLLIACANVANLQLARVAGRDREIALRAALGASRWRVVRQLLTESVMLSLAGAIGGLFLAQWAVALIVSKMPAELSQYVAGWNRIALDWRAVVYTTVIAVLAGIIAGLAPALGHSRPDISNALKEGGRGGTGRRSHRLRSVLVVTEVAASLVLLVAAGLLVKGFRALLDENQRFSPQSLLTMNIGLPPARYSGQPQLVAFYQAALGKLSAIPGVESASVVTAVPDSDNFSYHPFTGEGKLWTQDMGHIALEESISPNYFRTLRLPLLRGREFTDADGATSLRVAIINRSLAERYWFGEDVIGKHIKRGRPDSKEPWLTIVGVVSDAKYNPYWQDIDGAVYVPYTQEVLANMSFLLRTKDDPLSFVPAVRAKIREVDANQPIYEPKTLARLTHEELIGISFVAGIMAALGLIALALASAGVYGVMAHSVTERTHEIGIRLTLGAEPHQVLRWIAGRGIRLAGIGLGIGLAIAFAAARLLSSLMMGVSATDPLIFAGIPVLLAAIALAACYIPARRAMKVDPMVALRYE